MKHLPTPLALCPNLLFDFDGTLVDSGPLHDFAYHQALERHLPELLACYDYDSVKGKPTREALAGLGVRKQDDLDVLTLTKQRIYRTTIIEGRLELLPGARQLLSTLTAIGFTLFLVTSGSRDSIMPALRSTHIDDFFSGVVTADEVDAGKPAPDLYLYCLERFGLDAHTCIVVEDAISGVVAARRAGLPVIGVHTGGIAEWVDRFFPSLWDFKQWIEATVSSEAATP